MHGFDAAPVGIHGEAPMDGETIDLAAIRDEYSIDDEVFRNLKDEHVRDVMLASLPERERRLLELRYGLHDGNEWTLEAIAHELDLTRERIRQLEGQALSRLASLSYGPVKSQATIEADRISRYYEQAARQRLAHIEDQLRLAKLHAIRIAYAAKSGTPNTDLPDKGQVLYNLELNRLLKDLYDFDAEAMAKYEFTNRLSPKLDKIIKLAADESSFRTDKQKARLLAEMRKYIKYQSPVTESNNDIVKWIWHSSRACENLITYGVYR